MDEVSDLPFDYGETPANPAAVPKKCRRHTWMLDQMCGKTHCLYCGKARDEATAKRGRNNRSRGNSIERQVGKRLGLTRVGQYGTPTDLGSIAEPFAVQVKSGSAYPERLHAWLKAVPATAGQTPLLVVTDAPGPGHRRRALVVLDMDDWLALHGPSGMEAE